MATLNFTDLVWTSPTATTAANGLMSSTDKTKLDSLATVASTGSYADLTNTPTIPYGMPIGMIFPYVSIVPPAGAYLLNGQVITNCQTLYPDFWTWLNTEIANSRVRAVTDAVFESELSSTGNCGAFVLNSGSTTGAVRLPSVTTGFIQGTDGTTIGNSVAAGLPNITGTFNVRPSTTGGNIIGATQGTEITGAFSYARNSGRTWANGVTFASASYANDVASFSAALSNSIYGNSTTVQPPAVHYFWCIQVYNATTGLSTQEAAQITSEMQTKAPLISPALTGTPTAPTAASGTSTTQIATTAYADNAVSAHDTSSSAHSSLFAAKANTADLASVATSGDYDDLSNKPTIPSTAAEVGADPAGTAASAVATHNALTTAHSYSLLPTGSVIAYAGSTIPSGFLPCYGAAYSRTTYSALYAKIGTTYGTGDGSTTFNVPNLTDKFIQGNSTVGTVKAAGLPDIHGEFNLVNNGVFFDQSEAGYSGAFWCAGYATNAGRYTVLSVVAGKNVLVFDASKSNSIYGSSSTVQPPALTMNYAIKY